MKVKRCLKPGAVSSLLLANWRVRPHDNPGAPCIFKTCQSFSLFVLQNFISIVKLKSTSTSSFCLISFIKRNYLFNLYCKALQWESEYRTPDYRTHLKTILLTQSIFFNVATISCRSLIYSLFRFHIFLYTVYVLPDEQ